LKSNGPIPEKRPFIEETPGPPSNQTKSGSCVAFVKDSTNT